MSELSTSISHEPDKKGLTKYIKEEEIRCYLLAYYPEVLTESVKIAKELQGNWPNIEEYILNASVELNALEMILPVGERFTYREVVDLMKCCYDGAMLSPFDKPKHLLALVSQFAPIVIGDGKHFKKTSRVYQIFVQFVARWMKAGNPVNETNIHLLVHAILKSYKASELNKRYPHHQFYSDFRGIKTLADDIVWFSFDNETTSLSLDEDHKNGLALWLSILLPRIRLEDVFSDETAQFKEYLAQQIMSKTSSSTTHELGKNGSLTKYIKEDEIRRYFLARYSEGLAASTETAKELQGNLPNLEQFIINVSVKLNFLEMVLQEGKFFTYEEVVEFMTCCYEGVAPSPFDDPVHLSAFVSQFAPIVIGDGERFKTTSKAYQLFVKYIARRMRDGNPVNQTNIHELICDFSRRFEEIDPNKCYSHQPFLSDFKGLKALAADIAWFSYDTDGRTKSLSLNENHENGLALWLTILIPMIRLKDFPSNETSQLEGDRAQKSQETSSRTDNNSDRDKQEKGKKERKRKAEEKKKEEVFAVTEEVKNAKITKVLCDLFSKQNKIALNQIGSMYFEEVEKQKETFKNYKILSEWLLYALQKMGSETFKQEPQAFLPNEKTVYDFIKSKPHLYEIDKTDRSVSFIKDIIDSVSSHVYAFVDQHDNPVRLEDITTELNRRFPRLPSYLVDLEKMGQMYKFYDGVPLLIKMIDRENIFYTSKSKLWPANI